MNMLLFLSMAFPILGDNTQPNWKQIIEESAPSKTEIRQELKIDNDILMKGDSVKVLWNLDPKEYSYRNTYEFHMAINKYHKLGPYDMHFGLKEDMIDSLLTIIKLEIRIDEETGTIICTTPREFRTWLWYPEGIFFDWEPKWKECKLGSGYLMNEPKVIAFLNSFRAEPYIFGITLQGIETSFIYMAVLKDGKLIIHDIYGNTYDKLEELIIKECGSIEKFVKINKKLKESWEKRYGKSDK